VGFFLGVHHHYESVGRLLRERRVSPPQQVSNVFVVMVEDVSLATTDAIAYLRALRPEEVIPLYAGDPSRFEGVAVWWDSVAPRLGRLERLPEGPGGMAREVRSFLRKLPRGEDDFLTVVVPEVIPSRSLLQYWLRRPRSLWLKASLLFERGVVVTDVPLLPEERLAAAAQAAHPLEPERSVVLIPLSGVHAATIRAIAYAKSLHPASIEGIYFSSDPEEVHGIMEQWDAWEVDISLSIVDAPFRDLRAPLLQEVRKYTSRGDTVVTVVLPEIVVRRWWQHLLHNQTGLFIKRLLLFEPGVVVTSVPFRL
jgi:hypothetical protein